MQIYVHKIFLHLICIQICYLRNVITIEYVFIIVSIQCNLATLISIFKSWLGMGISTRVLNLDVSICSTYRVMTLFLSK